MANVSQIFDSRMAPHEHRLLKDWAHISFGPPESLVHDTKLEDVYCA